MLGNIFGGIAGAISGALGGGRRESKPPPRPNQAQTTQQALDAANAQSHGTAAFLAYLDAANRAASQTITTADQTRLMVSGQLIGSQDARSQATTYVVLAVVLLGTASLIALTRR